MHVVVKATRPLSRQLRVAMTNRIQYYIYTSDPIVSIPSRSFYHGLCRRFSQLSTPIKSTYVDVDQLYEGQDPSRHYDKNFSELSGKIPWEPDPSDLLELNHKWEAPEPNLNELIRVNLPLARTFFRNVLQQKYRSDMGMWNKWGCMEWKAGNLELARMIFTKASKISFHPDVWQSWACLEMEAKQFTQARRLYNTILATDPLNASAGLGLALLEIEIGDMEKASERFQALVDDHGNSDALILQAYGVFEASQQNMKFARLLFQAALDHPNATAPVWHAWAKAEYDAGLYKNCIAVVTRGLNRFPTHKWLIQLHAMALYKIGDVYEARRGFQRLVAGGLYIEASSYNAYAQMEETLGYTDVAIQLYTEALRGHPQHVPSAMALAILHWKIGQAETPNPGIEKARKVFEQSLERMQSQHHPVQETAAMMYAWGQFEEEYTKEYTNAKELYEEVTIQLPSHVQAWQAVARMTSRLGDMNQARSVLLQATHHTDANSTQTIPLTIALGKLEKHNRNRQKARKSFEQAVQMDRTKASSWNIRATLELERDPERAKNIIEAAFHIIPKTETKSWSILLCTYGRAFAKMNDYEKAVAAFKKSFQLQPKNWETHVIYAESVLQPNHAWEDAKKHLNAARNLLGRMDKRRKEIEHKLRKVQEQIDQ